MSRKGTPTVFILGAGKVGSALAVALKRAGAKVTLRPARKPLPRKIEADVVVLAVRDRDLEPMAKKLAAGEHVHSAAICVHVAGAVNAEPLAPLRAVCRGVAQMHPMISFASTRVHPTLTNGNVHVQGDPVAVRRARALAKLIGMTPRTIPNLDPIGYHAAAALTANGAVALAAGGVELLQASGVDRKTAALMLAPLLRSVADNIERLGFPQALTGPIRRGDPSAVERALKIVIERAPSVGPLFVAASLLQLPLAAEIGEVPTPNLEAIRAQLAPYMHAHALPSVSGKGVKKGRKSS